MTQPASDALPALRLYSRRGCCLCEGLLERLRALNPAPVLEVVDVDGDGPLQSRYGLEVPVLALLAPSGARPLPRVPPRLEQERLRRWLQQQIGALAD